MNKKIRVLVVDDSAFSRVTIGKMLEMMDGVEVVGYAPDGEKGLAKLLELKPDLVTLDLEMPKMGGFGMLRLIMQNLPTPVIVVSARSGEQNVFRALELGAVDFVAKPGRPISSELYSIRQDLENKVRGVAPLGGQNLQNLTRIRSQLACPFDPMMTPSSRPGIEHVVIGASTGGPPALHQLFSSFAEKTPIAIAIAQHMPPGFTKSFAERLNDHSPMEIIEASDGDLMLPGRVLVCPGAKNLVLKRFGTEVRAHISEPAVTQIYTPSVDVLFESAANVYRADLLGIVLTGMGNDGTEGAKKIHMEGGQLISEAEESCVVYGMPKEVEATGFVDRVVALPELCGELMQICRR